MKYKVKKKIALTMATVMMLSSGGFNKTIYANENIDSQQIDGIEDTTSSQSVEVVDENKDIPLGEDIVNPPEILDGQVVIGASITTPSTRISYTGENGAVFEYEKSRVGITITGLSTAPSNGVLVIPDMIEGKSVISINLDAFKAFKDNIKEIDFSQNTSIETINSREYKGFGLEAVKLPKNLKKIGLGAFSENNLGDVVIPDGTTTISAEAFCNAGITSIVIPNSVTSIGSRAFYNDTKVDKKYDNKFTFVKIPTGITKIEYSMFENVTSLTSVDLQNTTIIDSSAFANTGLTSIELPENIKTIGQNAFSGANLGELIIPENYTAIDRNAFRRAGITSVKFPQGLKTIGNYAFDENLLGDVVIPDGATAIGDYAFGNAGITSIKMPDSITTIGEYAFWNNTGNFDINPDYFNTLTSVEIPKGVTVIPTGMFQNVHSIEEVKLHDNVTKIGYDAFINNSLSEIVLQEGIKDISARAFMGNDFLEVIIPSTVTTLSVQTPFNVPTYAVVNKSGIDLHLSTGQLVDSWSKDRLHNEPADLNPSSTSNYNTVLTGNMYKNYGVKVVDLSSYGATHKGNDFISAPSFLTPEELIEFLSNEANYPVKDGYEFVGWDTENMLGGFINLRLEEETFNPYLLEDVSGIVPIFKVLEIETPNPIINRVFVGDESLSGKGHEVGATIEVQLADGTKLTTVVLEDLTWSINLAEHKDKLVKGQSIIVTQKLDNPNALVSNQVTTKIYDTIDNIVDVKIESPAPIINKVFVGDESLSGKGHEVGATIEVQLADGTKLTTVVLEDLTWSINLAEHKDKLVKGQSIIVTQKLLDSNALVSNQVTAKIYDTIDNIVDVKVKSPAPTINKVFVGDEKLSGKGHEVGAIIEVQLPDGTKLTTVVLEDLTWSINLAEHKNKLVKDGTIKVTQTLNNKNAIVSNEVTTKVLELVVVDDDDDSEDYYVAPEVFTIEDDAVPLGTKSEFAPYIQGYTDGTIRANDKITRAEFVTIMHNVFGNKKVVDLSNLSKFSDVNENAWYSYAVAYALENNIVEGYEDGTFRPNDYISRAEIAAVLSRINLDITNIELLNNNTELTDINNSWAKDSIQALVNNGVINGYEDNTFRPENNSTRAESVMLVNRLSSRPEDYYEENTFSDLGTSAWYYDDMMNASNTAYIDNTSEEDIETQE